MTAIILALKLVIHHYTYPAPDKQRSFSVDGLKWSLLDVVVQYDGGISPFGKPCLSNKGHGSCLSASHLNIGKQNLIKGIKIMVSESMLRITMTLMPRSNAPGDAMASRWLGLDLRLASTVTSSHKTLILISSHWRAVHFTHHPHHKQGVEGRTWQVGIALCKY